MLPRIALILSLFITTTISAQTTIVYFDLNSYGVSRQGKTILDKFLETKGVNSLAIFGHTDQSGSEDFNDWLSYQRAAAVRDYLLSKGLDQRKIAVVRGFGARNLLVDQEDSISMQMNRRVALTIGYKPTAVDSAIAERQSKMTKPVLTPPGNTTPAPASTPATSTTSKPVDTVAKNTFSPPGAPKREEPVVKQQKSEKLIEDIKDQNTKEGENIVLRNINFHPGSHSFLESALPPLQDLLETMQKLPTLEIEIQGHVCCQIGETDAIDNATGELGLSVNRAKAVYDYLVEKGISKNRLSYKGLAHQFPLIKDEVTEEDRIANRRVEIKIIKK